MYTARFAKGTNVGVSPASRQVSLLYSRAVTLVFATPVPGTWGLCAIPRIHPGLVAALRPEARTARSPSPRTRSQSSHSSGTIFRRLQCKSHVPYFTGALPRELLTSPRVRRGGVCSKLATAVRSCGTHRPALPLLRTRSGGVRLRYAQTKDEDTYRARLPPQVLLGRTAEGGRPALGIRNAQKRRRPPEAVHRFLSESVCREHIHICQTYLVLIKQIMCFVLIDIRSITIIIRRNTYCGFDVICLKLIFALNRRVSVVR